MFIYMTVIIAFLQICPLDGRSDLTVSVAVFSGRRDPVWTVPSSDPNYNDIKNLLKKAENCEPKNMPARLGYKGFVVRETGQTERLVVGRGLETKQLQHLLLKTMPTDVLREENKQEIKGDIDLGTVSAEGCGSTTTSSSSPMLKPYLNDYVRKCNNCYNYANAKITNTFSQPGQATAQVFIHCNGASVRAAAERDGLSVLNPHPAANQPLPTAPPQHLAPLPTAPPQHLVALVVDQGSPNRLGDFHWYRLDNNGKWSHKPGQACPTRKDNANNFINDPREAAMGHYRFVTFMISNRKTVNIQTNDVCV